MKAWFNEKNNWCIEFEKGEKETERFIALIACGARWWREHRDEYPPAYISAELFNLALGTIFIGQNYGQLHPTIDNPIVTSAEQDKKYLLNYKEQRHLNEKELELLRTEKLERLL